jgi:hypothetical protein
MKFSAFTICVSVLLSVDSQIAAQTVEPLIRIRVIETQLPFEVEVLAAAETIASNPTIDVTVKSNTSDALVVYLPSNQIYVRPLPPANGNNVLVTYSRLERWIATSNVSAADPFNSGGGPTNVNSFSWTTNPAFPRLVGTAGYLQFIVSPTCPNCR